LQDTLSHRRHGVCTRNGLYRQGMPQLWRDSVEAHRHALREATLDAVGSLIAEDPAELTMSGLAARAGVARATLYKYFPDAAAAVAAWHERQVRDHLAHLRHVHEVAEPDARLSAVLAAYVVMSSTHARADWAAGLHTGDHMGGPRAELRSFLRDVLQAATARGEVRDDVDVDTLTAFCLHALAAVPESPSETAPGELTTLVLDAIGTRGTNVPRRHHQRAAADHRG
jgi:AcrR family transcriptional regulator